jgi:hypothetical protein
VQVPPEQLPGVVSQQSSSLWQLSFESEQTQEPLSQKLLPQSLSCVHVSKGPA